MPKREWKFGISHIQDFFPEWASPAVAEGVIYFGTRAEDNYYTGNFYVLDASTGEKIDYIDFDNRVYSTPAVK
jgi:outer membrane protein assembly factor BamB